MYTNYFAKTKVSGRARRPQAKALHRPESLSSGLVAHKTELEVYPDTMGPPQRVSATIWLVLFDMSTGLYMELLARVV